ncbi:hypothetical protein B0F90DRAFT_287335 [Multifurca ochricompacta]|uniref:Alpha/beta hydrolase fold-3 domain-containing protein n=1 Tax=Multifurca ochricompacta TaxID=376703 RepID=A0AAD4M4Q1_9AGAM|nr:hypothetical protein B0F90DRAFT_287335 [Multifurca ochricompacta]
MSSSLTARTTLGLMPLAVGILLRHYYDKIIKDKDKERTGATKTFVPLRSEELIYDEAFSITRNFMDAATNYTVEDLQRFTMVHTPVPPSGHVVKLNVPISCCDDAARVLVEVFGGEHEAKRILGGVKWWQVRGTDKGIDAEWIMDKKDWKEYNRQERAAATSTPVSASTNGGGSSPSPPMSPAAGEQRMGTEDTNGYHPEMDEMRCILWAHGGGYYFGSVDQERYMIQRYARKIHGRVFGKPIFAHSGAGLAIKAPCIVAPNYRLAPQYPFPCALQDLLASYLFLIRPPEGTVHRPIHPSNIVIGGDSAGGGLAIALLQAIRDSGLPPPAGAVLVSPWCDLHHSFPSIFLNTDTDIVPATGLAIYKPSPVWPPPPDDVRFKVHDLLRGNTVRKTAVVGSKPPSDADAPASAADQPDIQPRFALIPESTVPSAVVETDETVRVNGEDGKPLEITRQIQLYTTNGLLKHPMVSPALAYLGGLPPLFVIASDREVLRDEIIYTAHRAANPEKYAISEEVKKLYPAYEGIENRMKPTTVHLQVYDDTAHVIPLMFIATTPAKYCYRAIATFMKHVTNMPPTIALQKCKTPPALPASGGTPDGKVAPLVSPPPQGENEVATGSQASANLNGRSPSSSKPKRFSHLSSVFSKSSRSGSDLGHTEDGHLVEEYVLAGDPIVYHGGWAKSPEHRNMIRERVAINGIIRPLEAEEDLPALQIPSELLGAVSERWLWRYMAGTERQEKKFASRIRSVAKHWERALAKAELHHSTRDRSHHQGGDGYSVDGREGRLASGWNLDWALDSDERPPPSSIVANPKAFEFAQSGTRRRIRGGDVVSVVPEKKQEKRRETFWVRRRRVREQGLSADVGAGAVPLQVVAVA